MEDTQVSRKKAKHDLPSRDEQLQLQQTDALFKSNLINLQIDEMLGEVRCNAVYNKQRLIEWTNEFRGRFSTSTLSSVTINSDWFKDKSFPSDSIKDTSIDFLLPKQLDIVGSYCHHTGTFPYVNIDFCVVMPSELFDKRYSIIKIMYFCLKLTNSFIV